MINSSPIIINQKDLQIDINWPIIGLQMVRFDTPNSFSQCCVPMSRNARSCIVLQTYNMLGKNAKIGEIFLHSVIATWSCMMRQNEAETGWGRHMWQVTLWQLWHPRKPGNYLIIKFYLALITSVPRINGKLVLLFLHSPHRMTSISLRYKHRTMLKF